MQVVLRGSKRKNQHVGPTNNIYRGQRLDSSHEIPAGDLVRVAVVTVVHHHDLPALGACEGKPHGQIVGLGPAVHEEAHLRAASPGVCWFSEGLPRSPFNLTPPKGS